MIARSELSNSTSYMKSGDGVEVDGFGGAIYFSSPRGELNITDSSFLHNVAGMAGGAIYNAAGALVAMGNFYANNSLVEWGTLLNRERVNNDV